MSERGEMIPAPGQLPKRWADRAQTMRAAPCLTKRDEAYREGYADALDDAAGWLYMALRREAAP